MGEIPMNRCFFISHVKADSKLSDSKVFSLKLLQYFRWDFQLAKSHTRTILHPIFSFHERHRLHFEFYKNTALETLNFSANERT